MHILTVFISKSILEITQLLLKNKQKKCTKKPQSTQANKQKQVYKELFLQIIVLLNTRIYIYNLKMSSCPLSKKPKNH